MLGLKLIHASKRGHRCSVNAFINIFRAPLYLYLNFEWKLLYFDSISSEVCSQKLVNIGIGSDDVLAPDMRLTIIWTSDGLTASDSVELHMYETLYKFQRFNIWV